MIAALNAVSVSRHITLRSQDGEGRQAMKRRVVIIGWMLMTIALGTRSAQADVVQQTGLQTTGVTDPVTGGQYLEVTLPAAPCAADAIIYAELMFAVSLQAGIEVEMWPMGAGEGWPWDAEEADANRVFWMTSGGNSGVRFDVTEVLQAATRAEQTAQVLLRLAPLSLPEGDPPQLTGTGWTVRIHRSGAAE